MVALIARGKATPEKLAAVTFTRKAAAQLRQRFQIALEDEARAADPSAAALLEAARDNLDRLPHRDDSRFLRVAPPRKAHRGRPRPRAARGRATGSRAPLGPRLHRMDRVAPRRGGRDPYPPAVAGRPRRRPRVLVPDSPGVPGRGAGGWAGAPPPGPVEGPRSASRLPGLRGRGVARRKAGRRGRLPGEGPPGSSHARASASSRRMPACRASSPSSRHGRGRRRENGRPRRREREWPTRRNASAKRSPNPPSLNGASSCTRSRSALLDPAVKAAVRARREQGLLAYEDLLLLTRDLLRDRPLVRRYFQGASLAPPRRRVPGHRSAPGRAPASPDGVGFGRARRLEADARAGLALRRRRPEAVDLPFSAGRHRALRALQESHPRRERESPPIDGELPFGSRPREDAQQGPRGHPSPSPLRDAGSLGATRIRPAGAASRPRSFPDGHGDGLAEGRRSGRYERGPDRALDLMGRGRRFQSLGPREGRKPHREGGGLPPPHAKEEARQHLRARPPGPRYPSGRLGKRGLLDLRRAPRASARSSARRSIRATKSRPWRF